MSGIFLHIIDSVHIPGLPLFMHGRPGYEVNRHYHMHITKYGRIGMAMVLSIIQYISKIQVSLSVSG